MCDCIIFAHNFDDSLLLSGVMQGNIIQQGGVIQQQGMLVQQQPQQQGTVIQQHGALMQPGSMIQQQPMGMTQQQPMGMTHQGGVITQQMQVMQQAIPQQVGWSNNPIHKHNSIVLCTLPRNTKCKC